MSSGRLDLPDLRAPVYFVRTGIAAACLLMLVACAGPKHPSSLETPEEREEFCQAMLANAAQTERYLKTTEQGRNVSEMSLGWFMLGVLTEAAGEDAELYGRFNRNDRGIKAYLQNEFSADPHKEIAYLANLIREEDRPIRHVAYDVLECLRHIPDSADPGDMQELDRLALALSLRRLRQSLLKAAEAP